MASVVQILPAALPVPAAQGGVSAAVDVRTIGGNITANLNASDGDIVAIEGSPDGATLWAPFMIAQNNVTVRQPEATVVGFIRLKRLRVDPTPGGGPTVPNISIVGQPLPSDYSFGQVAVVIPAADGVGAAVDVRALGITAEVTRSPTKAIVCSAFDAGDQLTLETSADANAPWVTAMQLQPLTIVPIPGSFGFIRIRRARIPAAGPRVGVDGATCAFMAQGVATSPSGIDVTQFGAGRGGADDAAAFNNAIAAAGVGGTVYVPPLNYNFTNSITLNVVGTTLNMQGATLNSSAANCIVVSANKVRIVGGTLNMLGTGATQYGINPSGNVDALIVDRVSINGTGVVGDAQTGFGNNSGPNISNLKILNCTVTTCAVGISLNADLGGSLNDCLVKACRVVGSVGTASGTGYGLHHANGSGNPSMVRFIGNALENCQRHSIYQARGSGVTIMGNHFLNHRSTVSAGVQRPALSIGRSSDVTVVGNVWENCFDCCIDCFTDAAGLLCNNITITGNVFKNWKTFPCMVMGTLAPDVDGFPTDVTAVGNTFFNDLAVTGSTGSAAAVAIYVQSGKRLDFIANKMSMLNAGSATNCTEVVGTLEGALTANYTDDVSFISNKAFLTGTNPRWHRMDALTCAAAIRLEYHLNRINTTGATFSLAAAQTNPNVYALHTPIDGLTASIMHALDGMPKLAGRDGTAGQFWVDLAYSASVAVDASTGSAFRIVATNGTAFTVQSPTNALQLGQVLKLTIKNTSGGALGAVTFGAAYKLSAWASPATGNNRSIEFQWDGTNWIEINRTAADVPN